MIKQEIVTLTLVEAGVILARILSLDPDATTVEIIPGEDGSPGSIRLTVTTDMSEVTE